MGLLVLLFCLLIARTSSNVATMTTVSKGPGGRQLSRGNIRVVNVVQDFANNFNVNEINSLDPRYTAINATFATDDDDIVYLIASSPEDQDLVKLTYDRSIGQYRAHVEENLYDYRATQTPRSAFDFQPRTYTQMEAVYKSSFQYVAVLQSYTFSGEFEFDSRIDAVSGPRVGEPRRIISSRLSVATWTEGFYQFRTNDRRLGEDTLPYVSLNGTAWDRENKRLYLVGSTPVDQRLLVVALNSFGSLTTVSERILFSYNWLSNPDAFAALNQNNVNQPITAQVCVAVEYWSGRGSIGVVKTISGNARRSVPNFGNRGPVQTDFTGQHPSFAVYDLDTRSQVNNVPVKLFDLPNNVQTVNSTTVRGDSLYISWYAIGGSGYVSAYSLITNTLVGSTRLITQNFNPVSNSAQTFRFLNNIDDCHFTQVVEPLRTCLDGHLDPLEVCEAGYTRLCADIDEEFVGGIANCKYDCLSWNTVYCKRVQPFVKGKFGRGTYGYCPRGWGVANAKGTDFYCEGTLDTTNQACILSHRSAYKRCKQMEECDTVEMIDPIHPIHSKCGNLSPCSWLRKLPFDPHQQWRSCVKPQSVCPNRARWQVVDGRKVDPDAPLVPQDGAGTAVRTVLAKRCRHKWGTVQLDGATTCACVRKTRVARKPLFVRRRNNN